MRAVASLRAIVATTFLATASTFATAARAHAQATSQQQPPQQQGEVLTGTVKSDSGVAIPNAQITVTPAGGGFSVAVTVRSNTNGRWTATMPNRAAEYFVTISAIGWVQQRTTAKSSGNANPVVVDV